VYIHYINDYMNINIDAEYVFIIFDLYNWQQLTSAKCKPFVG